MDSLNSPRTPSLDNGYDFDRHVAEDSDLHNFRTLIKRNVDNMQLVQLPSTSTSQPTTSGSSSTSRIHPLNFSNIPKKPTSPTTCHVCKIKLKGKRGLTLHLNRSPDCRRNVPDPPVTVVTPHTDSLPCHVMNSVKCPSTTVESLEDLCGLAHPKILTHQHKSGKGCKICHKLCTKGKFVSTSTHRTHDSIIPDNVLSVHCMTSNLIYLITCRKCKLQYVGETCQLLRDRIHTHITGFNNPNSDNHCRILTEHFSQGFCRGATFTIHIIEKLQGDGRTGEGKLDPVVTRLRKKKETEWMLKLRTVYPFGLNCRVGDEFARDDDINTIYHKFPSLKRIKEHLKIRTKNVTSSSFIADNFIYILNESLRTSRINTMNLIRVLLCNLKKANCRHLLDSINEFLSTKHDTFLNMQYFTAALDILKSKIGKPPEVPVVNKKRPSNYLRMTFNNKALDFINLQRILKDKEVVDALPVSLRCDLPTVVYQLTNTIRSKLFNYKEFVQSIDIDAFLADQSSLPCDCDQSSFLNHDHGHIVTGDLNIITDLNLRNLISKGPKYREPLPFSCVKAKSEILAGLDNCILSWSKKAGLSHIAFDDWKSTIISKIDDRISSLVAKNNTSKFSTLKTNSASNCLADLHSKYVMVPIDKAANNVAFICKRFYAQVLLKELGLLGTATSTYTAVNQHTPDEIIARHKIELKDKFDISVTDDMMTLPDIYWLPKLHKNPVGFRFIIASKRCTTKCLSKNVSSAFSLFQGQIDRYHKMAHFYSGIKTYWIVQNRNPILEAVKKSCTRRSAKCVSSFDFSTLYTKIPHDKLIQVLSGIIDFVFKGGTRHKIAINKSGKAYWFDKNTTPNIIYSKTSITEAMSYLIRNCYFRLGNRLFRQDIGIPMGSDPAPAFANLFLFHYESSWLNSIKKTDNVLARKFGQIFRYIDDLIALNDGKSFEKCHKLIYPEELQLNKENDGYSSSTFLDLDIDIVDGVFTTKLYDKRDNFGFDITRLPYRESNIPFRMFYSSISAECLRICRATSSPNHAISSIHAIITRMKKQGALLPNMKNSISKMLNRHNVGHKFNMQDNCFVARIFNNGV